MSLRNQQCCHIYTRGVKKGSTCGKVCRKIRESGKCGEHDRLKKNKNIPETEKIIMFMMCLLASQDIEDGLEIMTMENINKVWELGIEENYEDINKPETIYTDLTLKRL